MEYKDPVFELLSSLERLKPNNVRGLSLFSNSCRRGSSPRNIAPHRETRLAVNNTAIDLSTRRKRLLFRIAPENKKAAKFNLCGL